MKPEQFIMMIVMVAVLLSAGGCSRLMGGNGTVTRVVAPVEPTRVFTPVERTFAAALQQLRAGNESAARELLGQVVEAYPLAGVTDEALFRLSLLELRGENGSGETRAKELLDQLFRKYPASIWSRQAAPLAAYVQETVSLRARKREIRSLRNNNLSLSRDNKELRQSIERLKNLDLELEQKIRR